MPSPEEFLRLLETLQEVASLMDALPEGVRRFLWLSKIGSSLTGIASEPLLILR
jgi:hypothetical protein